MNAFLIQKSFEKAEEKIGSKVTSRLAKYLSDYILDDTGQPYGSRSLRDKFKTANENSSDTIDLKDYVQEALSHFLGYDSYEDFIINSTTNTSTINSDCISSNKNYTINKTWWTTSLSGSSSLKVVKFLTIIGCFIIAVIYISSKDIKWMIWDKTHYKEINFDPKKHNIENLKVYKEERIRNFHKIIPNCSTQFFKTNGKENLWYGKNNDGSYEFFTDLGKHPETGVTLKKITPYIIKKYVCSTYEK